VKTIHRVRANAPDKVFQADTVEILNEKSLTAAMAQKPPQNYGWNKVLTCVDVFTRVVFVVPIQYEKARKADGGFENEKEYVLVLGPSDSLCEGG